MSPAAPAAANWAVVLIHGVGDTQPGRIIDSVSSPLAAVSGMTFLTETQPIFINEKPGADHFPVFMRRAELGTQKIRLIDVYWADLTRVRGEIYSIFLALLGCAYGIRHLVLQAGLVPGKVGWIFQAALRSAIFLLRGPVFALYFFEAILCVFYLPFVSTFWDDPNQSRGPALVSAALLTSAVAALSGWRWFVRHRRRQYSVFWPSLLLITFLIFVHLIVRAVGSADEWYQSLLPHMNSKLAGHHFGEWPLVMFIIDGVLDRLYAVVTLGVIVAGIVLACAGGVAERAAWRSMWSAWLSVVLLVTLWELASAPVDLLAEQGYDRAFSHAVPSYCEDLSDYTIWFNEASLFCLFLTLAITVLLVVVRQLRWAAWSAAKPAPVPPAPPLTIGLPGQIGILLAIGFLFPVGALLSPLLALATGLAILLRPLWVFPENTSAPPLPPPRLLIGLPIQICLLLFACIFFPLAVVDGLHIHEMRWQSVPIDGVYIFYALVLLVLLQGSLVFRNVLHILMDIIIHFQGPGGDSLFLWPRYLALHYPVRERIARRLRVVLEEVLREKPTHLLFITHSQGTMIALEELRKGRWTARFKACESVTLVTFGSPLSNLYQNYLPLRYGDITCGRWQILKRNVRTWVNVYRTDDFVGTRIESSQPNWPRNVSLPPGLWLQGHTRYWKDEVFQAIRDLLPGK